MNSRMMKNKILRLSNDDITCLLEAKEFISANPAYRHGIRQIAARAGINRYKLTYGFKQLFGSTVHQYIIRTRMENARRLLMQTEKPVKEIAKLNGYSNTENFNYAFKKYFGHTASSLKKNKPDN